MNIRRTRRQPPKITDVPSAGDPADQTPDGAPELPAAPVAELAPPPLSPAVIPVEDQADLHVSVRQRRVGPALNVGILVVILILIVAGVFGGLAQRGILPAIVLTGWPLIIVLIALIWFLISFGRRSGAGLLGSTALIGIGLSLTLALSGGVPFGQSWLGLTFILAGIGTMLRGLLWRTTAA